MLTSHGIALYISTPGNIVTAHAAQSGASPTPSPSPSPTASPTPEPTPITSPASESTAEDTAISESDLPLFETAAEITEQSAAQRLSALQSYFADGSYWNHCGISTSGMEASEKALCITDSPCAHSHNGYRFCNIYSGAMIDMFPNLSYLTQCLGYASLISDLTFGTDAPVTEFYSFEELRIGDHIRLVYNQHSLIVTDIDWETETLTVTEVNADYNNCQITWGRTITKSRLFQIEGHVRYFTRYSTPSSAATAEETETE